MNLSITQKKIVETTASKVIVLAAAASGKTRCITERGRYLLQHGCDPHKLVIITFTNAAAEVMRERLGEDGKYVFIGTIHSYCNYLLRAYGIETTDILDVEEFDELFQRIMLYPKAIQPIEHLLLDEAQDSTELEYKFLLDIIKPKNYMLLGDFRQSIYEWRDAKPDILYNLSLQPDVTVYTLNENYRNGSAILMYAKQFLWPLGTKFEDNSISRTGQVGSVKQMEFSLPKIARTIKETPEYGKWFVLVRTNAQLATVQSYLEGAHIPTDTFKRAEITNEELEEKLNEDTVKVLTVHAAKGLENSYVMVYGCTTFGPAEESRICYVAATRAKERLYWIGTKKPIKNRPNKDIVSWE